MKDAVTAVLIAIVLLLLTGCCTPVVEYRTVTPPPPPVIPRPDLPIDNLQSGQSAGEVIQLHRATILVLQEWGLKLEAALNAYK